MKMRKILWALFFALSLANCPPGAGASQPTEIAPVLLGSVTSVAFSPDGRFILAGSGHAATLWDARSYKLLRTLPGDGSEVWSVAFSPDGTRALTVGGTAKLWEVNSGQRIRTLDGGSEGHTKGVFSSDGRQILLSGYDAARLSEADSDRTLAVLSAGKSTQNVAVAISADGTRILTGCDDGTARLWDAASGKLLWTLKGHPKAVREVAFSPDGKFVLTSEWSKDTKLWDLRSRKVARVFKATRGVNAFSPDGRLLAVAENDAVKLIDLESGSIVRTISAATDVDALVFSPDGHFLLTGNWARTALIFDVSTGQLVHTLRSRAAGVWAIAATADGSRVVVGSDDGKARVWDSASGHLLRTLTGHSEMVRSVAFSRDGTLIASASQDKTAIVWDAATGRLLRTFRGHSDRLYAVAFSPDASLLVTAGSDHTVRIWDVKSSRTVRSLGGFSSTVSSLAFSPDGRRLAVGSVVYATVWDVGTGRMLRKFKTWAVGCAVAFSSDGGRLLTDSVADTFGVWDMASGADPTWYDPDPSNIGSDLESVAFSPDDSRILTGSDDGTAALWETNSGQRLQVFAGHTGRTVAAFVPGGRRIVSGSEDTTVKWWDPQSGALLATTVGFEDGEWVTITPEGFFDASAHGAEQLTVVRGLDSYSVGQVYQALYRPDLVQAKLSGDPDGKVKVAAAKLDLNTVIASGGAPRVVIMSPPEGAAIGADPVEAEAEVSDRGGGVGKVEWRVNGVTVGIDVRGIDRPADDTASEAGSVPGSMGAVPRERTISVKQKLSLDPGENRIEVVAYNAKGLIASDPAAVTVKWEAATVTTSPRLYVLAVGINDYWDSRLRLTYAATDATAIAEAFKTSGAKLYDSIEVTTVLDADATAANLDRVFSDLGAKVRPRDVFVFFLAGHGKTLDGRYYFLPYDFRYDGEGSVASGGIDQDRFQKWFSGIRAQKSILLYDTCESGTLTRGIEQVTALDRLTRAVGRTVLSAATEDQPALEGYRGHGVFTYAVLDAIGAADSNENDLIEVNELISRIDNQVPELSYAAFRQRQVPMKNVVGTDFPLVGKVSVLGDAAGDEVYSGKPTHVVIAPAKVRPAPDAGTEAIRELPPGTLVTLIETDRGWALIAKDGRRIGYLEQNVLAAVQ